MKKHQLFLLHFAGGSCYSFDFLKKHLSSEIEFIPLELPGRGKRFDSKLIRTKKSAVQDYLEQIKALRNDQPYLVYGHSMGATLALNITKQMEDLNDPPYHLFVSGNCGPDIKRVNEEEEKRGKRHLMEDAEFKEELRELGGVPEEVLGSDELYHFFSPILRADFEVLEQDDQMEKGIRLKTPIYALMGSDEKYKAEIDNWKRFTTASFQQQILKGDHFFIHDHPKGIADIIKLTIKNNVVTT